MRKDNNNDNNYNNNNPQTNMATTLSDCLHYGANTTSSSHFIDQFSRSNRAHYIADISLKTCKKKQLQIIIINNLD